MSRGHRYILAIVALLLLVVPTVIFMHCTILKISKSSEALHYPFQKNDDYLYPWNQKSSLTLPGYERIHAQLRTIMAKSQILVVHLSGGWGNRYYTIMGALPLAIALDRALWIVLPEQDTTNIAIAPNRIDWRPWNTTLMEIALDITPNVKTMDFSQYSSLQQVDVVQVRVPQLKDPYQEWSPFLQWRASGKGIPLNSLSHRDVFHFLFRITPALSQKLQRLKPIVSPDNLPYLAMHVRTGSDELMESNPNNIWFVNSTAAIEIIPRAAMSAISARGLPKTTKWFVATDSLKFGQTLLSMYPDNVVISNNNLSLVRGLHIDKGGSKEGSLLTFADWLLLAHADVFLQAGSSSFSTSARLYRNSSCIHMDAVIPSAVKIGHKLPVIQCYDENTA